MEVIGASHAEADVTEADEPPEIFSPDFQCPDGHVITTADSLTDNPLLAMTLLNGVALPSDTGNLQEGKANNMDELCLFVAKVNLISLP